MNNIKRDAVKIETLASKMESTDGNIKVTKTIKPAIVDQLDVPMVYSAYMAFRFQAL